MPVYFYNYLKFSRASILSSIAGCVENKLLLLVFLLFLNGVTIYICALLLLATSNSESSELIFLKADIKPSGFLVKDTAVASAKYYLLLDTASCISCDTIGDIMRKTSPKINNIALAFPLSLSLLLLGIQNTLKNISESIITNPTITLTTADNLIS